MNIKENRNIKFGILLSYLGIFVNLIANIFLQRFINAPNNLVISKQYDLYSFSSSISSLLTILTLGLTSGYIRFASIAEKNEGQAGIKKINSVYFILLSISALLALIIGTLITVLFVTGSIPLSNYSSSEVKLISWFLFLGTINVALGFFSSVFTIFLNYKTKFIIARLLTLIFSTATPLISLPFLSYFNNLIAFSIVHIVLTSISLAIQIIYSVSILKYSLTFKIKPIGSKIFKEVLMFTVFVFLVEIFIQIDANADKILLGFFAPASAEGADASAVGSYNIAFSIVSVIGTSCSAVFSAYAPKINRSIANNETEKIPSIFNRTTEIALLVYFLIFGGFIVAGKSFILAWLGPSRFYVYYIVISLLIINLVPYTINISSEIQRAYNLHKFRSLNMLLSAFFNIVFSLLILIVVKNKFNTEKNYLYYQIGGVLIVTFLMSVIFNCIVMGIYNKKTIHLPIEFYYKKIIMYFVITFIPTAVTFIIFRLLNISSINLWLQTIIIGSTFVILFSLILLIFNRRFVYSLIKNKNEKSVIPVILTEQQLKKLKQFEIDILKDIIRVCNELNIEYYCVGGTALGAIKYNDFIPWDDDIDIAMKRCDYELFQKEGPKLLNKRYFVQSIETEKKFLTTFLKVRDAYTEFDELSTSKLNIRGGVFVDIFPIDDNFNSKLKKIIYKINYAKINSRLQKRIEFSTFKTFAISFLSLFIQKPSDDLIKENINILKNNKSDSFYCRGKVYKKIYFDEIKFVKFSELDVMVSKQVDNYLKETYGDISNDPPIEEQTSHHFVYNIKLDKETYESSNN